MKAAGSGLGAAMIALSAAPAFAAGIERGVPSTAILFEPGRYLEFSARAVLPDLEGKDGPGAPTGNLFDDYRAFGIAYKDDLSERLSVALIFDQPYGVDTSYHGPAPYTGTTARLDATGFTGIVAYDATDHVKVYGGLRVQSLEAEAAIPFVGGYTVETDRQTDLGYLLGAAYSRPDIALRVALTYRSAIQHDTNTLEFGVFETRTGIETPQSLTLEFQTGIAEDTLLFGNIHWADWSEFHIAPPNYPAGVLVDYEKDWTSYTLGLGRRFTDHLSGFVQASWEPATETTLTTLGPVDGRASVGVGFRWEDERVKITGGATYVGLGEAENVLATEFRDGSAVAVGLKVGFRL